jgi:hypothetical protein
MSTIKSSTTTTTAYSVEADTTGALVIQTGATPTTAVTVTATQSVGIGTTSPALTLSLSGGTGTAPATSGTTQNGTFRIRTVANGVIDFGSISATGAGWIQATDQTSLAQNYNLLLNPNGGNLLVGRTSLIGTEKFGLDTNGSNQAQIIRSTNTSGNPQLFRIAAGQFSGTIGTGRFITCDDGGTDKFIVAGSGNVTNTNNSYGAISDVKLKENIVDTTPKLADLMQVKVRNYNLIGSTTKQIGVVAQELEIVFPAMIDESPDRDEEGNELSTKTKAVKYSVFVPILIKAIQEQQALITKLQADVAALKGTQ